MPAFNAVYQGELSTMANLDLVEELAYYEVPDELWGEIGWRLGISGPLGVRHTNQWMSAAERLRRYMKLWEDQPEAGKAGGLSRDVPHQPNDIDRWRLWAYRYEQWRLEGRTHPEDRLTYAVMRRLEAMLLDPTHKGDACKATFEAMQAAAVDFIDFGVRITEANQGNA